MLLTQPVSYDKKDLRSNVLKLETSQFGLIEIDENKIITVPTGLPAFPGKNRFIILERENMRPFFWLQCTDDAELALTIINPFLFIPDYNFGMERVLREMSWEDDGIENLKIYVVVNAANGGPEKITVNLLAPLLINTLRYEAIQLVLYDSQYSHRHLIFSQ